MTATLKVSEIFESLQGEGASAGQRCTFLRLAGCNLHCTWCDTRYTWDWSAYSYADYVTLESVETVAEKLRDAKRLVITGGEPLLQQGALEDLLARLPNTIPVEVETNGTRLPSPLLLDRVNQWNVSPKLVNSGESEARRLVGEALLALRDTGRAYLKLVVAGEQDALEVEQLVKRFDWPEARVLLMPQARSRQEMVDSLPVAAGVALRLGYGLSARLHLLIWDGERGR